MLLVLSFETVCVLVDLEVLCILFVLASHYASSPHSFATTVCCGVLLVFLVRCGWVSVLVVVVMQLSR